MIGAARPDRSLATPLGHTLLWPLWPRGSKRRMASGRQVPDVRPVKACVSAVALTTGAACRADAPSATLSPRWSSSRALQRWAGRTG